MFRRKFPPVQVVQGPRHQNTIQNEIKFKHNKLALECVKAYRLPSKKRREEASRFTVTSQPECLLVALTPSTDNRSLPWAPATLDRRTRLSWWRLSGYLTYHRFSIQRLYILPTEWLIIFVVRQMPEQRLFPVQHPVTPSYNWEGLCLMSCWK
jgi:hypothetical protein